MRFFSFNLYKNLIWIYLCITLCFGYALMISSIPDTLCVEQLDDTASAIGSPFRLQEKETAKETLQPFGKDESIANGETKILNSKLTYICYLFGMIPVKEVSVEVKEAPELYASGKIVGIYEKTEGVLVLDTATVTDIQGNECSPAKNIVKAGDYILAMNGKEVRTKSELIRQIAQIDGGNQQLTLCRDKKQITVTIEPVESEKGDYMMGIWVKDDMAGIGTITYFTSAGAFGALGHGIGDGATGELLSVSDGAIYNMQLTGIEKGKDGEPGELSGMIYYGQKNHLGSLEQNGSLGVYGNLDEEELQKYIQQDRACKVCYKQDIKKGKALLLSDISGSVRSYEIEILDVDYNASDSNKGILLQVTDQNLIQMTGGIVQGMSGSPIIQNGKIIGGVTHVLVNDPTKGYGIFIENML